MPETSSTESAPKHSAETETETDTDSELETSSESAPESPAPTGTEPPAKTKRATNWWRWIAVAALVVAVIAAAGAGAAWYRLTQSGPTKYSDQETTQAKKNLCGAYAIVQRAIVVNTHMAPPNPNDSAGKLGVEANARLSLLGGGAYLRDRVAAESAAPAELAKVLTATASEIEQLGINYMAGASNEAQDPLKHALDAKIGRIKELCT